MRTSGAERKIPTQKRKMVASDWRSDDLTLFFFAFDSDRAELYRLENDPTMAIVNYSQVNIKVVTWLVCFNLSGQALE